MGTTSPAVVGTSLQYFAPVSFLILGIVMVVGSWFVWKCSPWLVFFFLTGSLDLFSVDGKDLSLHSHGLFKGLFGYMLWLFFHAKVVT